MRIIYPHESYQSTIRTTIKKNKITPKTKELIFKKTVSEATAVELHFIKLHHERYKDKYPELIPFLEENLLYLTVMLKRSQVSIGKTSIFDAHKVHPLDEFHKLYTAVIKKLIGNNYQRKREFQPATYAYVDFEDSRAGYPIDPKLARNPHVHALALCPPQYRLRFQVMMADMFIRHYKAPRIEGISIRQFDSRKKSLFELAEYCAKGYENFQLPDHSNIKLGLRMLLPK
jgi:hypothetical protein